MAEAENLHIREKTFTRWVNFYLKQADFDASLHDLQNDMKDGVLLSKLILALYNEKISVPEDLSSDESKIALLTTALEHLNKRKITTPDVKLIFQGDLQATLDLIFSIIVRFQFKSEVGKQLELTNLLSWCNKNKHNIYVNNFSLDFKDGKAFAAIASTYYGTFKFEALPLDDPKQMLEYGIVVASKKLDIPQILDVQDFLDGNIDKESVITFLGLLKIGTSKDKREHSVFVFIPLISKSSLFLTPAKKRGGRATKIDLKDLHQQIDEEEALQKKAEEEVAFAAAAAESVQKENKQAQIMEKLKEILSSLDNVSQIQGETDSLRSEIDQLTRSLDSPVSFASAPADAQEKLSDLEQKLQEASSALSNIKEKESSLRESAEHAKAHIEELRSQVESIKKQKEEAEVHRSGLEQQQQDIEKRLEETLDRLTKSRQIKDSLESELESIKAEAASLEEQMQQYEADASEVSSSELMLQIDAKMQEVEELQQEIEKVSSSVQELENSKRERSAKRDEFNNRVNELKSSSMSSEERAKRGMVSEQFQKLQLEIISNGKRLDELKQEKVELESYNDRLQQEIQGLYEVCGPTLSELEEAEEILNTIKMNIEIEAETSSDLNELREQQERKLQKLLKTIQLSQAELKTKHERAEELRENSQKALDSLRQQTEKQQAAFELNQNQGSILLEKIAASKQQFQQQQEQFDREKAQQEQRILQIQREADSILQQTQELEQQQLEQQKQQGSGSGVADTSALQQQLSQIESQLQQAEAQKQQTSKQTTEKIKELENAVKEALAKQRTLKKQLEDSQEKIAAASTKSHLQAEIEKKSKQLSQLNSSHAKELAVLEETIKQKQTLLVQKQKEIDDLVKGVSDISAKAKEEGEKVTSLKTQVADLNSKLQEANDGHATAVTQLKSQSSAADDKMEELQKQKSVIRKEQKKVRLVDQPSLKKASKGVIQEPSSSTTEPAVAGPKSTEKSSSIADSKKEESKQSKVEATGVAKEGDADADSKSWTLIQPKKQPPVTTAVAAAAPSSELSFVRSFGAKNSSAISNPYCDLLEDDESVVSLPDSKEENVPTKQVSGLKKPIPPSSKAKAGQKKNQKDDALLKLEQRPNSLKELMAGKETYFLAISVLLFALLISFVTLWNERV